MRRQTRYHRNGKPRQREYDKSARTKAAIVAAAMHEFAAHGIAGARVDRIARAARVNNHALYYHFGNKDALFRIVLEHGYDSFRANRQPVERTNLDPRQAMVKIVSDVFDFVQRAPEHMAIAQEVNRSRGAKLDAEGRSRVRLAARPLLADVEMVLREGKAQGQFSGQTNAEQLYLTIFALCSFYFSNAYTVSAVVGHDLLDPRAVKQRKQEICRFVLAALRP
jgi:TetR/AcrR family transcriptional regulator